MRPFLLGKSLSYQVFHSKWLQDWMTKLPKKEAGVRGGAKLPELFPPVPSFQKSTGKNMDPAEQTALSAALKWFAWLLEESWPLAKGSDCLGPLWKSSRALGKCFP